MTDVDAVRERLRAVEQDHLVRFAGELSDEARATLVREIESIEPESLPRVIDRYVRQKPEFAVPEGVEPAPYYPNDPARGPRQWDRQAARAAGEALLRAGKVACFTVAGGQGSRLGYDGPKGCYPAGAITKRPLFQFFAEGIRKTGAKYGVTPAWYIMTSPQNHETTVAFFEANDYFGLGRTDVVFFPQGVMPAFDRETGRVLLAEKGRLALTPDGHGGSLKALHVSGSLDDMARRGVEHISYFQVDNPIVRVADPVFLGLHASVPDSSGEMSSKMLPKVAPEERVGIFCRVDGRTTVIEYSDMPMERQRERLEDGSLRFLAGSIAIHAMGVEFVRRLNEDPDFELPFHRADKKVACVDVETGEALTPSVANAVKLERFVFDAVPLARASIVYETERVEEFAPIKNAEGTDSPASSTAIQTERAARWLEAVGVDVPRGADGEADCVIELSPLTAVEAEDLRGVDLPKVERGARVVM